MFRKFAVRLNSIRSVCCNPIQFPVQYRFNSTNIEHNDNPKILITGKYLGVNIPFISDLKVVK